MSGRYATEQAVWEDRNGIERPAGSLEGSRIGNDYKTTPLASDKFLNPIPAYDALHAIDVELHMVTEYGCKVGETYDQISSEHIRAAKMMLETLITAQKQ